MTDDSRAKHAKPRWSHDLPPRLPRRRGFVWEPQGCWGVRQCAGNSQHIREQWEKLVHYLDRFDARIEPYLLAYLGIARLVPLVDRQTHELKRVVERARLLYAGSEQVGSSDLFRSWSLFDARAVVRGSPYPETPLMDSYASIGHALSVARGFDPGWMQLLRILSDSRLGLHVVHDVSNIDGIDGVDRVCVLRELVTHDERPVFVDGGFLPSEGDLLLARVLPPLNEADYGYALDTCLIDGCERGAWGKWFDTMLVGQPDRVAAYENLMKRGGGPFGSCSWLEYASTQVLCVARVPTLLGVPAPAITGA